MSLDKNLTEKKSGDLIRSADWNAVASETVRLDDVKLDRGLIGIQMLQAPSWDNKTSSRDWQPVIRHTVNLEPGTELLLVGQGHGLSEVSGVALDVVITVNGTLLGQEDTNGLAWGMGIHQPVGKINMSIWTQIVVIAEWPAEMSGVNEVVLAMRCRKEESVKDGSVQFNAPTLWLIRLGAS
ncbi:hypothetical protein [Streptomyces torulosus]|uniref:hypothetical protein n=1 Tax=Streptomyces torulosus TaxID=68276 RepID=UPI0006EBD828|nr:hypothetical protein [Streptomyces torulosus]